MKEIGLIEDNKTIRDLYSRYFKRTQSFDVVFSVSDIADAISFKKNQPRIILLDVNLPSGSGIDGIKLLADHFPQSKIVILSAMEDSKLTTLAVQNGAVGYLLKTSSMAYICESLLQIDNGGMSFSPATISHLIQPKEVVEQQITELTKRELELVELLSGGFANKIAADKLNVTYFTINQHLKNIYKKLNINSKPELISWFLNRKNRPSSK
ncbi:response regulator [Mucilaginibacter paludis]|uniref:Two component transcriptional regulator, LuxR family n=1 Tax=Mucilaginibacter paludis DSM 18603 TaxID=714943 RepID=H1Y0E5_9SPHI|nr:response regulator transcription factor [Mucilaginibacter paludis]EHQ28194.1 two component transcriptional regulator, LuxR family [Mucilaginibacter paludis DSM 18603]